MGWALEQSDTPKRTRKSSCRPTHHTALGVASTPRLPSTNKLVSREVVVTVCHGGCHRLVPPPLLRASLCLSRGGGLPGLAAHLALGALGAVVKGALAAWPGHTRRERTRRSACAAAERDCVLVHGRAVPARPPRIVRSRFRSEGQRRLRRRGRAKQTLRCVSKLLARVRAFEYGATPRGHCSVRRPHRARPPTVFVEE